MAKVVLDFGMEVDLFNKAEAEELLRKYGDWQIQMAEGLRQADLPLMRGNVDGSGNLALGADVAGGTTCGPSSGWYWAVKRVSVDGLVSGESVKLYKETRFVCTISVTTGYATFGKDGLVLKGGEYLRVTGSGLTHNEQISVYGEYASAPGPLQWKLISG